MLLKQARRCGKSHSNDGVSGIDFIALEHSTTVPLRLRLIGL
jgi:hypothetical protein